MRLWYFFFMKNVMKNVIVKMQKILEKEELKILEITLENELLKKQAREKKNNEQLLDEFIKSKVYENCSQETIAQYKRENLRFLGKIHKKVENVDKKDIEKYLADYREERKVSERTLNNARAFISAFFICRLIVQSSGKIKSIIPFLIIGV